MKAAPRERRRPGIRRAIRRSSSRGKVLSPPSESVVRIAQAASNAPREKKEWTMKGARLLGHAIHPMLIVFPLGLLATAVVFDLVYLASGNAVLAPVAKGALKGMFSHRKFPAECIDKVIASIFVAPAAAILGENLYRLARDLPYFAS